MNRSAHRLEWAMGEPLTHWNPSKTGMTSVMLLISTLYLLGASSPTHPNVNGLVSQRAGHSHWGTHQIRGATKLRHWKARKRNVELCGSEDTIPATRRTKAAVRSASVVTDTMSQKPSVRQDTKRRSLKSWEWHEHAYV